MKLTRVRSAILLGILTSMLIGAIAVYILSVNRRIGGERDRQALTARVEVEERALRSPSSDGVTLYLSASDVRAVAAYQGGRYLATSGGLISLDEGGNVKRRFTTLDGLPENDLTALAVFGDKLYVGTASTGLVAFDGQAFTGYRFTKPSATHVTVLVGTESELLIGTLDGGLIEYDGNRFSRRFNSATGADFSRVTALLPFESRLYVGTQDSGLYIWREAHIEHISINEGLPSPHVTAVVELPAGFSEKGSVAVATDFGVVGINDANEIKLISNRPNVTSLAVSAGHLWAGLFSGGIVDLTVDQPALQEAADRTRLRSGSVGLPASAPATVWVSEGKIWGLTREGAFTRDERASRPAFELVAGSLVGERVITAGHITALAGDGAGRLWVGYFDRGIDLILPETSERVSHIEDERVREINHISFDRIEDRMLVATSRGLVIFGNGLKQTLMTREQGGLISESVAHVLLTDTDSRLASTGGPTPLDRRAGRAMVIATAGGLSEVLGGRVRSITAFHGLSSNHLYSSASVGSRLFVGSLAGLAEIEGLRVVRAYKTSNSRLSHDWVTALVEADGTLYIGTNGGGVDALLPTGEWIDFAGEPGRFEVNQNAMHYDGERLYVGTSDRGLFVYNTRDRKWTRISAGLASQCVTAITSDDSFLYIGTLNGLVRIEKRVVG